MMSKWRGRLKVTKEAQAKQRAINRAIRKMREERDKKRYEQTKLEEYKE